MHATFALRVGFLVVSSFPGEALATLVRAEQHLEGEPCAAAPPPPASSPKTKHLWRSAVGKYRTSSWGHGIIQLITTLVPMAGLFWAMYWSLNVHYALTLLLAVPTAGFIVRTFIIMHDCSHGSFFPSKRANEIVGFIAGVLTLTPFVQWRRDHAMHHASSGDLDRRGHGDIHTLTVNEYLALDRVGQFKYRMFRHPFILFGLGPIYLILSQRWRSPSEATGRKQVFHVHATNVAIVACLVAAGLLAGFKEVALVFLPSFLLAAAAGIWLFYVQHQFEDTYWEPHEDWDFTDAAIHGSSYYKLPRVLEWMTGSIGLHHVHHADPKIPNYNLRQCHDATDAFKDIPEITLRESLRTTSLKLWDEEQRKLVGFDAVDAKRRELIV